MEPFKLILGYFITYSIFLLVMKAYNRNWPDWMLVMLCGAFVPCVVIDFIRTLKFLWNMV